MIKITNAANIKSYNLKYHLKIMKISYSLKKNKQIYIFIAYYCVIFEPPIEGSLTCASKG